MSRACRTGDAEVKPVTKEQLCTRRFRMSLTQIDWCTLGLQWWMRMSRMTLRSPRFLWYCPRVTMALNVLVGVFRNVRPKMEESEFEALPQQTLNTGNVMTRAMHVVSLELGWRNDSLHSSVCAVDGAHELTRWCGYETCARGICAHVLCQSLDFGLDTVDLFN